MIWQQKALELFPSLQEEIKDGIYYLFFELLPRCIEAHAAGDEEELRKIYSYAEWCFYQQEKDLWNAAGVAFYEHLGNDPLTREQIPLRLSPEVFTGVAGLLERCMEPADFSLLKIQYSEHYQCTLQATP